MTTLFTSPPCPTSPPPTPPPPPPQMPTPELVDKLVPPDPTIVAAAYRRERLYLFTRREPIDSDDPLLGRDVFNEKPSGEEVLAAQGGWAFGGVFG